MLDPEHHPTVSFIVDSPGWLRRIMGKRVLGREADATVPEARRNKASRAVATFAARYCDLDIELRWTFPRSDCDQEDDDERHENRARQPG